jgi:hypothetical protein
LGKEFSSNLVFRERVAVFSLGQSAKAELAIAATLAGMLMEVKLAQ